MDNDSFLTTKKFSLSYYDFVRRLLLHGPVTMIWYGHIILPD